MENERHFRSSDVSVDRIHWHLSMLRPDGRVVDAGGPMRVSARWSVGATVIVTVLGGIIAGPKLSAFAATPQQWQLTPPGALTVAATIRLDSAGGLTLEVRRGATQVLKPSTLGIRTTAADLSKGLTFTGRADSHITQSYTTASGRRHPRGAGRVRVPGPVQHRRQLAAGRRVRHDRQLRRVPADP
jgi:hypothetical protein